tara:strand:+ start:1133 stop:1441 length:309 start_codon:yes stop_codon:yes gene_type:complete
METIVKIIGLDKGNTDSLQDVIYKVKFYLTVIENGVTRTEPMEQNLDAADPSSFTAYSSLTEETVKSWVTNHSNYSNQIKIIQDMIFREGLTEVTTEFPWES